MTDENQSVHLRPDLDLVRQQLIEIEGVGLRLKPLESAEKTFLAAAVGKPIIAVAIEEHKL